MVSRLLVSLIVLSGFYSQALLAITLDEAYKAAVEKTEVVPIADSQVRYSDAVVEAATSTFMPTLAAKGDYQYYNTKINGSNENDQTTTRLTLTQSLFAGGGDKATLNAAESVKTAQELNVAGVKNNLYAQVAQSFYELMSAVTEVTNIEQSIELVQKRVTELQKLTRVGRSRNIEVLAAQAQQSVLEAQKMAAIAQRRIAKNNFANITGLDRNTDLTDELQLPTDMGSLKKHIEAISDRPDVKSLEYLNKSYDSSIRAASAGHWPSLDLSGNYYLSHDGAPSSNQNADNWNALLTLTVPLFEGGYVKAKVKQAEEEKFQADLQLQKKKRDAESEIRTAYNNLVSAVDQIKALEKALIATEQNYKEQEKDYRYKLVTNLDVIQSFDTYLETKRSLDKTRYQAMISYVQLKASTNQLKM